MLITKEEWKDYCNYWIQQFVDLRDYFSCVYQETSDDKNLRLFCYLRLSTKKLMQKSISTSIVLLTLSETTFLQLVRMWLM